MSKTTKFNENQQEDFIAYLADKFKEVADREYQRGREDERADQRLKKRP